MPGVLRECLEAGVGGLLLGALIVGVHPRGKQILRELTGGFLLGFVGYGIGLFLHRLFA
ncbi:MAG TPA: hypothetical protein VE091_00650 [Gemmatimonadales bacterium]|nr:hypothetical protein [Gemmatimonadales bacterium]